MRSSPWTPTDGSRAAPRSSARARGRGRRGAPPPAGSRRRRAGSRAAPRVTSPMIRIASPGPGERLPPHHPLRHAELLADAAHLVLEEQPQRLDELHRHVRGEPADVVVRLDLRGDAVGAARLDHVRVERPLDEEARRRRACAASSSKTRMNSSPIRSPLLLRLGRRPRAARGSAPAPGRARAGRGSGRRTSRRPARPRSRA